MKPPVGAGLFGQDEVKRKKAKTSTSKSKTGKRKFRLGQSSGREICGMAMGDEICEELRKHQAAYSVPCDKRREVWAFVTPCIEHNSTLVALAGMLNEVEFHNKLRRDWPTVVEDALNREARRGN